MNTTFRIIGRENIALVKPLWEKLNRQHGEGSRYFREHYTAFTFEKRCEKFRSVPDADVRIELVASDGAAAGYCIATVENGTGEIDSLFVDEMFRGAGYGRKLVENALAWLKRRACDKIVVAVADGNEAAFGFYAKCGFFPRMTYLQLKE